MAKNWYVLQVYTGYENKVERDIQQLLDAGEISSELVTALKVPVEEVVEVKNGKKRTYNKKFLPGYLLLELDIDGVSPLDWKNIFGRIKRIQGVTGFVGSDAKEKPVPIGQDEAKLILQRSGEIKGEKSAHLKQNFAVGEQVKVTEGPFATFTGAIEEVNLEKNKLKIMVQIFGRAAPVEVDMLHVERV
ncbi:MAG: transcription termination/antitermination protein NusG [Treponemataceae bacterium]|nr:MAG: transcription termination/antitermination protein NusG [Treponemataceae bacterium]